MSSPWQHQHWPTLYRTTVTVEARNRIGSTSIQTHEQCTKSLTMIEIMHLFIIYIICIHNQWKICFMLNHIIYITVSFEIVKINKIHVLWTHFIHNYYSQIWVLYTLLDNKLTISYGHCEWKNTVKTLISSCTNEKQHTVVATMCTEPCMYVIIMT